MARNTSVSLGGHFTSFIDEQVESGRYGSASEVIRAALRLLEDEKQQHEWLRARIAEGMEDIEQGRIHEESDQFWDDLNREVGVRIARGDQTDADVLP